MSVPFVGPAVAQANVPFEGDSTPEDKRSLSDVEPQVAEFKSHGVKRIEAINSQLTTFWRGWLWVGAFAVSLLLSISSQERDPR